MNQLNNHVQKKLNTEPLLKSLSADEKRFLLANSGQIRFAKGQSIFEQGDPGEVMYLIENGQVKLSRLDLSGKELVLAVLGPGEFFGEMAVLNEEGRSSNATAYTDLTLSSVSRRHFRDRLLKQPEMAVKIIAILCQRLRITDELLQELAFGSVKERLQRFLMDGTNPEERIVKLDMTHQELATKIGTSRETVTRTLNSLREEGWTIEKTVRRNCQLL